MELAAEAKELRAPLDVVRDVAERGWLPVPMFCAGGIATPADASLTMQLGAEGNFVGSGIFKSEDPERTAKAVVEATTHAGYMPDAEPMVAKAIAERRTGRLLGFQIVGGQGSAKRIDTAATAITAEMTVMDVVELDLAYAPPFSSVWDPVQVAARATARKL